MDDNDDRGGEEGERRQQQQQQQPRIRGCAQKVMIDCDPLASHSLPHQGTCRDRSRLSLPIFVVDMITVALESLTRSLPSDAAPRRAAFPRSPSPPDAVVAYPSFSLSFPSRRRRRSGKRSGCPATVARRRRRRRRLYPRNVRSAVLLLTSRIG